MFIPLFVFMIAGGGLEELGWRGIAQPELERYLSPAAAAVLVGLVWSLWHLPLFVLPGVSQYGTNFPVFALGVVGSALILAWLYAHTGSILVCIAFHASSNAILTLAFAVASRRGLVKVLNACLGVATGVALAAANATRRR